MPHGLHPGAYSGWHSRQPLELNQPADVVTEVHHPDLKPRPHDADGAHDLAAHRILLLAEYVLDTRAYKNHLGVDKAHNLIRKWDATDAAVHDSQKLDDLLDLSNTGSRRT